MKISVKTLKGNHFDIDVQPTDKVLNVKKQIEQLQGAQIYPSEQQLLIYQGKVLNDETTIQENKVTQNNSLVLMLSKTKASTAGTSSIKQTPPPISQDSGAATTTPTGTAQRVTNADNQAASTSSATSTGTAQDWPSAVPLNLFPQDPTDLPASARVAATSHAPNTAQSDNFRQGLPTMRTGSGVLSNGALLIDIIEFLRNSPQFQSLRPVVEAHPKILERMLQNLSKKYPRVMEIIQDHQAEILRLATEPVKGSEGNSINLSPEEREAIERLEAMGFAPTRVILAFLSCDKNEELALKYLQEHGGDDSDNNN